MLRADTVSFMTRADVLNRGFGGDTRTLARVMIDQLLPHSSKDSSNETVETLRPPVLVALFFGANDACGPHHHMVGAALNARGPHIEHHLSAAATPCPACNTAAAPPYARAYALRQLPAPANIR